MPGLNDIFPTETNRQRNKQERLERRDQRLTDHVKKEAEKEGIDLKHPAPQPLGEDKDIERNEIDEGAKQAYGKNHSNEVEGFSRSYEDPNYRKAPTLNMDQLKESYKKERRAKWSDVLTAIGLGLQGKNIDPSKFKSSRIAADRQAQYKQYKDVVDANKKAGDLWDSKYRTDLYNFLDDRSKNDESPEDAALTKAKTNYYNRGNRGKGKNGSGSGSTKQAVYIYKDKDGTQVSIPLSDDKKPYLVSLGKIKAQLEQKKKELADLQLQRDKAINDAEGGMFSGVGIGESDKEAKEKAGSKYQSDIDYINREIEGLSNRVNELHGYLIGESDTNTETQKTPPTPQKSKNIDDNPKNPWND